MKRKAALWTSLVLALAMLFALTGCSSFGSIKKAYENAGYTESESVQEYQDRIVAAFGEEYEDYENSCTVHLFSKKEGLFDSGVALILEFHSTKKLEEATQNSATFKGIYEDAQKSDYVKENCVLLFALGSDAASTFINA